MIDKDIDADICPYCGSGDLVTLDLSISHIAPSVTFTLFECETCLKKFIFKEDKDKNGTVNRDVYLGE